MQRALACAAMLLALSVSARATDYSVPVLTTTPVLVIPRAPSTRFFLRLINVAAAGGPTAWCSRSLTTTLAPNMGGAYPLAANGGAEQYALPGYVPFEAEWCAAASGTIPLTAEASQ